MWACRFKVQSGGENAKSRDMGMLITVAHVQLHVPEAVLWDLMYTESFAHITTSLYPFMVEETKMQRYKVTCPMPWSLGLRLGCLVPYSALLKSDEIERKWGAILKMLFKIFTHKFPEMWIKDWPMTYKKQSLLLSFWRIWKEVWVECVGEDSEDTHLVKIFFYLSLPLAFS